MPNNLIKSDAADDKLIEVGDLRINSRDRSTQLRGEYLKLTATEFNLLYVLVQNAGDTVSKSKLSIEALQKPLNQFDRSIEVHIHRLRSKLGVRDDGRPLIQTIHKQGFQFLVS
jgi:DNA-binding response OmpR family regulator